MQEIGYQSYQSWDQGRSWKLGDTYFVIMQAEDRFKSSPYHRKNVGLNHLAFYARDAADVDSMTKELQGRGTVILYPERHPYAGGENCYAVFFEDPDRIKVEFVAKK